MLQRLAVEAGEREAADVGARVDAGVEGAHRRRVGAARARGTGERATRRDRRGGGGAAGEPAPARRPRLARVGRSGRRARPLLPTPLFALWRGAAAYLEAWQPKGATLAVQGDAAAAQRPAEAAAAEAAELFSEHALAVVVSRGKRSFRLRLPPGARDDLGGGDAEGRRAEARRALPADDGGGRPDALRPPLPRGSPPGAPPADVSQLLPARPFKWCQWLGGLGPVIDGDRQPASSPAGDGLAPRPLTRRVTLFIEILLYTSTSLSPVHPPTLTPPFSPPHREGAQSEPVVSDRLRPSPSSPRAFATV